MQSSPQHTQAAYTQWNAAFDLYHKIYKSPWQSQAARQGLAVLMASSVVVLELVSSTLRKRQNFISIDLTFGESDYVREVTSPDKDGSGPMSGRDATWGQHIRVMWLFCFFLFFYSSTELKPIPVNQFSRTIAQKTLFGIKIALFWNIEVFYPKNTPKIGRKGQLPPKIKCRLTPKR